MCHIFIFPRLSQGKGHTGKYLSLEVRVFLLNYSFTPLFFLSPGLHMFYPSIIFVFFSVLVLYI